MATIAISALPAATAAATTDVLPIVQSGTTKQVTNALLFTNSTLVAPALGTPASGTLTNCTGLPVSTGISGLGAGVATFLATPTSANLAAAVTNETGSGALVFATSPTLVTPALGTPSALVGTNITGTAAGLTAGNVTTNANLTGAVTSVGNATSLGSFTSAQLSGALTDETGTGSAVFANTPTLVTPVLGVATGTSITLSGFNATSAAAPTIASATTITPTTPIAFVSGTTPVVTITAPSPISAGGGAIALIPTGAFTWTTAGNIAVAGTAVVSRTLTMTYDATTTKWYPSYV